MEFDKNKVYTALNADELKVGSKVYLADNLEALKSRISADSKPMYLKKIAPENCEYRFTLANGAGYALAYLVDEPEDGKLKWTDLKVGDVIRYNDNMLDCMITEIDRNAGCCHIRTCINWLTDEELKDWEKVEE